MSFLGKELPNVWRSGASWGCLIALAAMLAGAAAVLGADVQTNQLQIGDEVVESKVVNGKIVGDRWMGVGDTLLELHTEVTPLEPKSKSPGIQKRSEPVLRLIYKAGRGRELPGGINGLHGLAYMARDWSTPALVETNVVDVLSTSDKSRIVMMVIDNGPIYSSTNFGASWSIISAPGDHEFPLTAVGGGGGFYAKGTIRPSPRTGQPAKPDWYATVSVPDGRKLVIAGGSESAPVLSILSSSNAVILSWPSSFTGYGLLHSTNLAGGDWYPVTNAVHVVGGENQVTVPGSGDNVFYRLKVLTNRLPAGTPPASGGSDWTATCCGVRLR